jgi:hypothetical protein
MCADLFSEEVLHKVQKLKKRMQEELKLREEGRVHDKA